LSVTHAAGRVVTCDPARATASDPLGVIEDGAVRVEGGRIAWVGALRDLDATRSAVTHHDGVLTPGLVDAHTHACWVGSRHDEYAVRMAGGDYEAIARAGGGIVATQRAIHAASEDQLVVALSARLARMVSLGVTTVEVKSGYGLEPDDERKQLRAIARVATDPSLPHVVATYLALHAVPPTARDDRAGYVARVSAELVPSIAESRMAEFVDAYIDRGAFQLDEAAHVFAAARAAGLGVRAHVGQFADIGGAELAASFGASSADHLEHVSLGGLERLAVAGTAAVLLPAASFTLGQAAPPVAAMRAAGVTLVVASDANPGTAPTESLPLAMALAVRQYGLTPTEVILAATRNAATSLRRFGAGASSVRGALTPGAAADFVVWDLPHEIALVQPWGVSRARLVVRDGGAIYEASRLR
jgi:imidazolonepropionase